MTEPNTNPIDSVIYGDTELAAVQVDFYGDGDEPFCVKLWQEGGTSDLEYFPSWEECFEYVQAQPLPEPAEGNIFALHGRKTGTRSFGFEDVEWRFVNEEEAKRLAEVTGPDEVVLKLSDLAENPAFKVEASPSP